MGRKERREEGRKDGRRGGLLMNFCQIVILPISASQKRIDAFFSDIYMLWRDSYQLPLQYHMQYRVYCLLPAHNWLYI
jgi:hypothetical protein